MLQLASIFVIFCLKALAMTFARRMGKEKCCLHNWIGTTCSNRRYSRSLNRRHLSMYGHILTENKLMKQYICPDHVMIHESSGHAYYKIKSVYVCRYLQEGGQYQWKNRTWYCHAMQRHKCMCFLWIISGITCKSNKIKSIVIISYIYTRLIPLE